jgi:hypothetical protein
VRAPARLFSGSQGEVVDGITGSARRPPPRQPGSHGEAAPTRTFPTACMFPITGRIRSRSPRSFASRSTPRDSWNDHAVMEPGEQIELARTREVDQGSGVRDDDHREPRRPSSCFRSSRAVSTGAPGACDRGRFASGLHRRRVRVTAHGSREMPIWRQVFRLEGRRIRREGAGLCACSLHRVDPATVARALDRASLSTWPRHGEPLHRRSPAAAHAFCDLELGAACQPG